MHYTQFSACKPLAVVLSNSSPLYSSFRLVCSCSGVVVRAIKADCKGLFCDSASDCSTCLLGMDVVGTDCQGKWFWGTKGHCCVWTCEYRDGASNCCSCFFGGKLVLGRGTGPCGLSCTGDCG